jgi:4-hydroxybenzoate polyprenyltransferase
MWKTAMQTAVVFNLYHAQHAALVAVASGAVGFGGPMLAALFVCGVYNLDRSRVSPGDVTGKPQRSAFVLRHLLAYRVVAAVSLGLSMLLAVSLLKQPVVRATVLASLLAGVLYVHWKSLPVAKNIGVPLVWAVVCGATRLSVSGFVFAFCWSFSVVLLNDVGDVDEDRADGVQSIAVLWGAERSITLVKVARLTALCACLAVCSSIWPAALAFAAVHAAHVLFTANSKLEETVGQAHLAADALFWTALCGLALLRALGLLNL